MFKSEKGVSAVEFALIAPLLFVLTFGIIEFSLLLFDKAVLTNASREAARAAVVYNVEYDSEQKAYVYKPFGIEKITKVIETYTNNYKFLISLGGSETPATIYPPEYTGPSESGTPEPGGYVKIQVGFNYRFLVFQSIINLIGGSEFANGIPLLGTTVMRMEGVADEG